MPANFPSLSKKAFHAGTECHVHEQACSSNMKTQKHVSSAICTFEVMFLYWSSEKTMRSLKQR